MRRALALSARRRRCSGMRCCFPASTPPSPACSPPPPSRSSTPGAPTPRSPLHRLEHALAPWVAFLIVPLFGFANAGVSLGGLGLAALLAPLPLGIAAGLFLGKQLGIFGAVRLCGPPRPRRAAARRDLAPDLRRRDALRDRLHDEPVHRRARLSRPIRRWSRRPRSASCSARSLSALAGYLRAALRAVAGAARKSRRKRLTSLHKSACRRGSKAGNAARAAHYIAPLGFLNGGWCATSVSMLRRLLACLAVSAPGARRRRAHAPPCCRRRPAGRSTIDFAADPVLRLRREQTGFEPFRAAIAAAVERHPGTAEAAASEDEALGALEEARAGGGCRRSTSASPPTACSRAISPTIRSTSSSARGRGSAPTRCSTSARPCSISARPRSASSPPARGCGPPAPSSRSPPTGSR